MKTRAVLFDLDGTLLNTLTDIASGCNQALSQFGLEEKSLEQIRLSVGNGFKKLVERIVPQGIENPQFEQIFHRAQNLYAQHALDKTCPYEGILPLMEELKKQHILMGIISNKPDAEVKKLARHFFADFVSEDAAVGEKESEGIRRKPAPDAVLSILKTLNVSADQSCYVGDSDVDIETAHNAKLFCISVTWGFRTRDFLIEHGAQSLIDKPQQLIQVLP